MDDTLLIAVDELALFLNLGWPGDNWAMTDEAVGRWEQTFAVGDHHGIYQPRQPGTLIRLADYDAKVVWQGSGKDPTRGRGYRLVELFHQWRAHRGSTVIVACVPPEKLPAIRSTLLKSGCLLLTA